MGHRHARLREGYAGQAEVTEEIGCRFSSLLCALRVSVAKSVVSEVKT
jgi:hypothetical protein